MTKQEQFVINEVKRLDLTLQQKVKETLIPQTTLHNLLNNDLIFKTEYYLTLIRLLRRHRGFSVEESFFLIGV